MTKDSSEQQETLTPRVQAIVKRHLLCERCGGMGRQQEGCWDGKAYAAPAGLCDDCLGVGFLGYSEVPEEEFWKKIKVSDCCPHIVNGKYPYTSQFKTPSGRVLGARVGIGHGEDKYYL